MENLLVSFSGGETSAYMAQYLWKKHRDRFNMIFVFSNTGEENEETLQFVHRCSLQFGFPVVWIEAVVNPEKGVGTTFKEISYLGASRDGEPFEEVIKKYGIPNRMYPHCSRELKGVPIHKYAKSVFGNDYYTAIGIRSDEFDRMDANHKEKKFLYPLIDGNFIPMTKPKINFWWSQQPFRLELKGYQGNCKTCWKKSDAKLFTLAIENVKQFNFMADMESKYGYFIPDGRSSKEIKLPITFFRGRRSALDIINQSKSFDKSIKDDSLENDESCEIHSQCG